MHTVMSDSVRLHVGALATADETEHHDVTAAGVSLNNIVSLLIRQQEQEETKSLYNASSPLMCHLLHLHHV